MMPKTLEPTKYELSKIKKAHEHLHAAAVRLISLKRLGRDCYEFDQLQQRVFEADLDLQVYLGRFTDHGDE